jgi:hypothetical protein
VVTRGRHAAERHDPGDWLASGMRHVAALIVEFLLIACVVIVVFLAVKGVVSLAPRQGP